MWIINKKIDLLFILFPGTLVIPLLSLAKEESLAYIIIAFIALVFLDTGHVYTTIFRIYKKKHSYLIPLFSFTFLVSWLFYDVPYFWEFIFYITIFHNVRQLYGVTKWYQTKTTWYTKTPGRFLYLLTLIPFIAFHFSTKQIEYYTILKLFRYNSQTLFLLTLIIYTVIVVSFIGYMLTHKKYIPVHLSIISAASIYGFGFLIAKDSLQQVAPIVVTHGSAYIVLMGYSMKKLSYQSYIKPLLLLIAVALIFGFAENTVMENMLVNIDLSSFNTQVVISLLLTPLLSHYTYDMFIWKKTNKEFRQILKD